MKSFPILAVTVVLLLSVSISARASDGPWAGPWEVRYAQHHDQRPEWTAKGYVPRWRMTWNDEEAPDVSWCDQEHGESRGWLLLARPIRIPDPPPVRIAAQFDYKTHCDLDAPRPRSGVVHTILMPRQTWDRLARDPEQAELLDPDAMGPQTVFAPVHGQGEDVHDWSPSGLVEFVPDDGPRSGEEWMAGVAWGAYHYHCHEWGALRRFRWSMVTQWDRTKAFWNAFDLARPGLEPLRSAVERDDFPAAEKALAGHLRKPGRPRVANPVAADPSESIVARALETLEGTYRLAGCPPYTFEGEIVWNHDPFDYNQWAIALNRHLEWPLVASAYLKTGESRYAEFWEQNLRHWIASMPVRIASSKYLEGPYHQAGRASLSLDAGIRMGTSWFPTFEVFRTAPEVSDAALVDFTRSCYDHAIYLMREESFRSGSNWGAMESNGLYHIGVMLPEFREAAAWRETGMQRTYQELELQVYPDGAQTELAPGYHGVSLRNFLAVMRLARANNLDLPEDFVRRMERMFDYYLRVVDPALQTPPWNDSGRASPAGYFTDACELFPHRQDFLWLATGRQEGNPPAYLATVMPWAGGVFFRSGWDADAFYLAFDTGPFGTGHQHEDKLGILVHAHRHNFLTEGGNYAYDRSPWRSYVLSTRAHNTVRIDGEDQNCRQAPEEHRATEPATYGFVDNPQYAYARDSHTAGYTGDVGKNVAHRRRVLFVKPDWWIVVDDFAAADARPHTAQTQFLMEVDEVEIEAESLRATSSRAGPKGARLAVVPLAPAGLSVRVAKGEQEPEVRGFIPRGFEKLAPAPAVLYEQAFVGAAVQAYALFPYVGDACPLASVESRIGPIGQAVDATLTFADGRTASVRATATELVYVPDRGEAFRATEEALKTAR